MGNLNKLAAIFIIGSAFGPLVSGQQATWRPFTERRPYLMPPVVLNKDAKASDPAGIHLYAEDLAHYLLPEGVGDKYTNSFADRLAKAEREAREGTRKLIPDTQIVEAYNELLKRENLTTKPANLDSLRRYRTDSYPAKTYSALITADRNGANCYPGEAVFLLTVLRQNDGDPYNLTPVVSGPRQGSVEQIMGLNVLGQSRRRIIEEFNAVAKTFGI